MSCRMYVMNAMDKVCLGEWKTMRQPTVMITVIVGLVLFTACSTPGKELGEQRIIETERPEREQNDQVETLASGLNVPWAIEKAGNTFYISERPGNIVKVEDGNSERQSVSLTKDVLHKGEGGFLGLTLATDFASSSLAYAYHTYEEDGDIFNRVVELRQIGDGWVENKPLLERIPGGTIHNGGRIKIGPDNKLYITTGDAGEQDNAQDLDSLAGKILRMELNGDIPEDNPFPDSYVYSYGHRNSQGIVWNEDGSEMYSAEHGPSGNPPGHDEINRIEPGANYGWPLIIGSEARSGMEAPLFHSGEDTWAPSGLAYVDGQLFVAGLRGMQLRVFDLGEGTSKVVFEGEGRLRDVAVSEGNIYVLTNNGDGRGDPRETDDRLLKIEGLIDD